MPGATFSFAVVAQSPEFLDRVRNWADPARYSLTYVEVESHKAAPAAKACLHRGVEVVLYQGGPGHAVKRALGKDAVNIGRTDIDVVNALRQASKLSKEIIFTQYSREEYINDIADLFCIKLHPIQSKDYAKLRQDITYLYNKGIHTLVGGYYSCKYIEQLGGTGFYILPHINSIENAFHEAEHIAEIKRAASYNHENLLSIFQQVEEAVVCIDEKETISFITKKALDFLNIPHHYSQKDILPFFPTLQLRETLADMSPRTNILVDISDAQYILSTYPYTDVMGKRGVMALLSNASAIERLSRKIGEGRYSKGFVARYTLKDILGDSRIIQELKNRLLRFASTDASVFIYGETGVGKELIAQTLHTHSARSANAFVAVNCAALPENLIESELFGYESGAFTGAQSGGKPGLFELAHKGSLFLDEIGEMSHAMQLRLLRVLEAKEVMRLGGRRVSPVDVRVICASHKHLLQLVSEKKFRQDLYYRVSTLKLSVPPLRERMDDIPVLVKAMLHKYGKNSSVISKGIMHFIQEYQWPGNIRELFSIVEAYCLLLDSDQADDMLFAAILSENSLPHVGELPRLSASASLRHIVDAAKQSALLDALHRHHGNKYAAAKSLGISYPTLWRLLQQNAASAVNGAPVE